MRLERYQTRLSGKHGPRRVRASFWEAIDIILFRATFGVPPILAFDLRTVTLVASFLCL